MQRFKENDTTEPDIIALFMPTLVELGIERDTMFSDCFECFLLGDILYDLVRDPLSGVISREVYRSSFPAIHESFTRPGTFEFYLDCFRKVFTDDVEVEFVIPDPGKLEINITALSLETFYILTRQIVDDAYVYDRLVTSDTNDPIVGRGLRGIKTQEEIDGLVSEISAYGVFTTVTLTLE